MYRSPAGDIIWRYWEHPDDNPRLSDIRGKFVIVQNFVPSSDSRPPHPSSDYFYPGTERPFGIPWGSFQIQDFYNPYNNFDLYRKWEMVSCSHPCSSSSVYDAQVSCTIISSDTMHYSASGGLLGPFMCFRNEGAPPAHPCDLSLTCFYTYAQVRDHLEKAATDSR